MVRQGGEGTSPTEIVGSGVGERCQGSFLLPRVRRGGCNSEDRPTGEAPGPPSRGRLSCGSPYGGGTSPYIPLLKPARDERCGAGVGLYGRPGVVAQVIVGRSVGCGSRDGPRGVGWSISDGAVVVIGVGLVVGEGAAWAGGCGDRRSLWWRASREQGREGKTSGGGGCLGGWSRIRSGDRGWGGR